MDADVIDLNRRETLWLCSKGELPCCLGRLMSEMHVWTRCVSDYPTRWDIRISWCEYYDGCLLGCCISIVRTMMMDLWNSGKLLPTTQKTGIFRWPTFVVIVVILILEEPRYADKKRECVLSSKDDQIKSVRIRCEARRSWAGCRRGSWVRIQFAFEMFVGINCQIQPCFVSPTQSDSLL
jgi:hypothetical protein